MTCDEFKNTMNSEISDSSDIADQLFDHLDQCEHCTRWFEVYCHELERFVRELITSKPNRISPFRHFRRNNPSTS